MRIQFALILVTSFMSSASTLIADEVDIAEEKLANARIAYASSLEAIQAQVRTSIESKINAEEKRKNPDLTKIETLELELKSLEGGEFPSWIERKHKTNLVGAKNALLGPLKELKAAYARSKDLEKAKKVQEEITKIEEEIKNPIGGKSVLQADLVSEGRRVSIINGVRSPEIKTVLTTRNVNDKKFNGNILIKAPGGDRTYFVDGGLQDTKIEFRAYSTQDKFNQQHEGSLKNGEIAVQLKGTAQDGKQTVGNMLLRNSKQAAKK